MTNADCFIRGISIHALREEGDPFGTSTLVVNAISIHALREEGDKVPGVLQYLAVEISIHALREEGDPFKAGQRW